MLSAQPAPFSSISTPVARKNGDLIHNMEAGRLPLLTYINVKSIIFSIYVYFM
ncbi:hypothetical protein CKO_00595 [Citrobacter koseri ATCC BAA-895]|uniref:Uncharacterized protein n=1 Tax=Citrobacter koseri (strain ATCC BAA-895 / CDC 4225-83 / SGSC4696) TaxID=290338 RepID=A8AE36_CITK8|nr:hypothetical protein CKO_00595 [Citrobacter koseri ATCC BAA-895]